MPELPDLTVFAENLTDRLKDKEVKSIELYFSKRINATKDELQSTLSKSKIRDIKRNGKELEFVFTNDSSLYFHLMLSGRFSIVKENEVENINYKIAALIFADNEALVMTDPQGLASLKLNPEPTSVPDALEMDIEYLKEKINKKARTGVKSFLIDQKIIRGIGNAYADEILWEAKISPKSIVGELPENVVEDLAKAIKKVLLEAVEKIKEIDPNIISGEVREFLSVHNSSRRKSPTGYDILQDKIASKKTYYTEEQVLYA